MSLDHFEILSKLGDGAYSIVYKVRRISDGAIYALKKVRMQNLNKKERKNALNEVRILASIHHPNIISYKEAFFDEAENLCLVMEYADSGDLYQRIVKYQKRNRLLSEEFIWRVFTQITSGLKALHDLDILHRDMKSANVFLNSDGSVKLGDMNVSKVAKNGLLYTQTGTPYYASPEVWQDKPYNIKSDIWSLGCVLYEAATLKPPFRADDMQGLFDAVVKGEFVGIPHHFSKDLRYVIKKLLQNDPGKRPNCDQILGMQAVKRHIEAVGESFEPSVLIDEIKFAKDQKSMSDGLPRPNYSARHKSEVPALTKSPSKPRRWGGNKSFVAKDYSYVAQAHRLQKDVIKESYGVLKLPKIKQQNKLSPLPSSKIKGLEEYLNMPKPLQPTERLKKLREAYLARPVRLYIY